MIRGCTIISLCYENMVSIALANVILLNKAFACDLQLQPEPVNVGKYQGRVVPEDYQVLAPVINLKRNHYFIYFSII